MLFLKSQETKSADFILFFSLPAITLYGLFSLFNKF